MHAYEVALQFYGNNFVCVYRVKANREMKQNYVNGGWIWDWVQKK